MHGSRFRPLGDVDSVFGAREVFCDSRFRGGILLTGGPFGEVVIFYFFIDFCAFCTDNVRIPRTGPDVSMIEFGHGLIERVA